MEEWSDDLRAVQPEELTPRQAWQRYFDRRWPESTDHSMKTYYYRLKQFVEYLERIEAVEDGLSDRVHIPKVSDNQASSDKELATEDARPLLEYYRRYDRGSRDHALLEVFWNTGARLGAVRVLDVRDYHPDEQYLEFVHRPESDTPLKKKVNGERPVAVSDAATDALDAYLKSSDRWDKGDDHDREPLFSCRLGRPGQNTVRCWTYVVSASHSRSRLMFDSSPPATTMPAARLSR